MAEPIPNKHGVYEEGEPDLRFHIVPHVRIEIFTLLVKKTWISSHDFNYATGGEGHGLSLKWNHHKSKKEALIYELDKLNKHLDNIVRCKDSDSILLEAKRTREWMRKQKAILLMPSLETYTDSDPISESTQSTLFGGTQ